MMPASGFGKRSYRGNPDHAAQQLDVWRRRVRTLLAHGSLPAKQAGLGVPKGIQRPCGLVGWTRSGHTTARPYPLYRACIVPVVHVDALAQPTG